MKIVCVLFLLTLWSSGTWGFNINSEQSTVYKEAIQQSLKKKPKVGSAQASSTTNSLPIPKPTNIRRKGKLDVLGADYPYHPSIHTFGNVGWWGAFHAFLSPLATFVIDKAAYKGENVRMRIAGELKKTLVRKNANVMDMCCGTGTSTRALGKALDANCILGVDTSAEMVAMAQVLSQNNLFSRLMMTNAHDDPSSSKSTNNNNNKKKNLINYFVANAEDTKLPNASFDLVTIMYGFHEAPFMGRQRMLVEAHRLLAPGGTLAVVDIAPSYEPSPTMLAGEPFVLEYKKNIQRQLRVSRVFDSCRYKEVVEGHVGLWTLKKSLLSF